MAEFEEVNAFSYVVLVDRVGEASEIIYDGKRIPVKGAATVPRFVAEWLFRNQKYMVWSREAGFTNRYGIKDGPEDLIGVLGEAAFETSPITIDPQPVEGWNVAEMDPDAASRRALPLRRNPADFAHQGGAMAGTFGKER